MLGTLFLLSFCAFSKGSTKAMRGPAYRLDFAEIGRRAAEAVERVEVADARRRPARGALTGLARIDGLAVSPSQSNFVWVEAPVDAGRVHAALLARGIVVRSFHAAGGRLARRLRITVGTRDENDALLAALPACL